MKLLTWLGAIALVAIILAAVGLRTVGHDPGRWHVDPTTSERTGRDNDVLIAPEGATAATPDAVFEARDATPAALLFQFDAIARNADRVEVVAGTSFFTTPEQYLTMTEERRQAAPPGPVGDPCSLRLTPSPVSKLKSYDPSRGPFLLSLRMGTTGPPPKPRIRPVWSEVPLADPLKDPEEDR